VFQINRIIVKVSLDYCREINFHSKNNRRLILCFRTGDISHYRLWWLIGFEICSAHWRARCMWSNSHIASCWNALKWILALETTQHLYSGVPEWKYSSENSSIGWFDLGFIHNTEIPVDDMFRFKQCVCKLYTVFYAWLLSKSLLESHNVLDATVTYNIHIT
jgi:hypothetical protein